MVQAFAAIWLGLTAVAVAGLVALAARTRRHWDEPGGKLYTCTLLAFAGFAVVVAVWLRAGRPKTGLLGYLYIFAAAAVPVFWGGFAAVRSGVAGVTGRRTLLAAPAVGAASTLNIAAREITRSAGSDLPPLVASGLGLVLSVGSLVGFLVAMSSFVVGVGLVLHDTVEYDHISAWQGASLTTAASMGWLGAYWAGSMTNTELLTVDAGMTATGVLVVAAAGAFWLASTRFRLFEHSVAAGSIGRDEVVETMEDAVVVVDDEGRVVDSNPVAQRLFEMDAADATGEAVATVVGEPLDVLRTADLLALETLVGVREFEPRASPVTGAGDDRLGYSLVLRDVTERRTREERLQVLNRVLRHNLRNEVSVISGYAELLGENGATVALDHAADEITETAHELAAIGEKARVVERMMSEPPGGSGEVDVGAVVERCVARVRSSQPTVAFAVDVPDGLTASVNANVLAPVLENVVENAAEHNDAEDPRVEVRVTQGVDPSTVTVTVVDNGPGIPEDEREVLESGNVTPLEHGSGLGLWIAKWGTTRLGGELSFAATEPRGTIVTLRLPVDGPETDVVDAEPYRFARAEPS